MHEQFLEIIKKEYSLELIEKSSFFFIDFFYYKRNIQEFITIYKINSKEDKEKIITFLLNLYPVSDLFLKEIFKLDENLTFINPITIDTINFLCNAFIEEVKDLNIDFELESKNNFKKIFEIRDIIELKRDSLERFSQSKKELLILKDKDTSLSKEIKELEEANLNSIKENLIIKQKKYDELLKEKNQAKNQLDKLNIDLQELNKYIEFKDKVQQCRAILKDLKLNSDYSDKIILD